MFVVLFAAVLLSLVVVIVVVVVVMMMAAAALVARPRTRRRGWLHLLSFRLSAWLWLCLCSEPGWGGEERRGRVFCATEIPDRRCASPGPRF